MQRPELFRSPIRPACGCIQADDLGEEETEGEESKQLGALTVQKKRGKEKGWKLFQVRVEMEALSLIYKFADPPSPCLTGLVNAALKLASTLSFFLFLARN